MTTADYLAEVRLRSRRVGANGGPDPGSANRRHRANEQSARDVPRLVAAIDAALRLASELDAEDGYDASDGEALGEVISRGDRIREAITTALLETRMIV